MKLNELKKIAEECDYKFGKIETVFTKKVFFIRGDNDIQISESIEEKIWISNPVVCHAKDLKMIEACVEFAKTPLKERGDILDDEKCKDILDDKEHEYLSAVIRPFRNEIKFIEKDYTIGKGDYSHIYLQLKDECITLPKFKTDTMYKNMKLNKEYTLEELGL